MTTQTDDYEGRIRNLETTVTRHDAILPTLATKEDLARLQGISGPTMNGSGVSSGPRWSGSVPRCNA